MLSGDSTHFDIDVDLGPLLQAPEPLLVPSTFYEQARPRRARPLAEQRLLDAGFHNTMLRCQWQAHLSRNERRHALRAPLASCVHVSRGKRILTTDISASGLCCTGRPADGFLDVEFSLPGLAFPVATRTEVANFRDHAILPFFGLRFLDLEAPYLDHIVKYIQTKRRPAHSC